MTAAAQNDTKWRWHSIDDTYTYGNGSLWNLDFLLWTMGRNVSEGSGSISETVEDDGTCGSATDDSGRQREWRKRVEAFGRRWKMVVQHTTIVFSADSTSLALLGRSQ